MLHGYRLGAVAKIESYRPLAAVPEGLVVFLGKAATPPLFFFLRQFFYGVHDPSVHQVLGKHFCQAAWRRQDAVEFKGDHFLLNRGMFRFN